MEFVRDESSGHKIFSISGRGTDARIEIDAHLADAMPTAQVREAVDMCPVGAIIEKGVGYNDPIGQRTYEIQSIRHRSVQGKPP